MMSLTLWVEGKLELGGTLDFSHMWFHFVLHWLCCAYSIKQVASTQVGVEGGNYSQGSQAVTVREKLLSSRKPSQRVNVSRVEEDLSCLSKLDLDFGFPVKKTKAAEM